VLGAPAHGANAGSPEVFFDFPRLRSCPSPCGSSAGREVPAQALPAVWGLDTGPPLHSPTSGAASSPSPTPERVCHGGRCHRRLQVPTASTLDLGWVGPAVPTFPPTLDLGPTPSLAAMAAATLSLQAVVGADLGESRSPASTAAPRGFGGFVDAPSSAVATAPAGARVPPPPGGQPQGATFPRRLRIHDLFPLPVASRHLGLPGDADSRSTSPGAAAAAAHLLPLRRVSFGRLGSSSLVALGHHCWSLYYCFPHCSRALVARCFSIRSPIIQASRSAAWSWIWSLAKASPDFRRCRQ
jgi:hypothetical protein